MVHVSTYRVGQEIAAEALNEATKALRYKRMKELEMLFSCASTPDTISGLMFV
jgi:hypothetical protein